MAEVMNDLGIQEILAQFGIDEVNNGASMGSKWFKTRGERIDSRRLQPYRNCHGHVRGHGKPTDMAMVLASVALFGHGVGIGIGLGF